MRTLLCAAALAWPGALLAQGFQLGPDPTFEWEGHMDYTATAATLIDCVGPACGGLAGNNCDGLASATAVMDVVPESDTLQVVYAQVRWAASTPPDADVDEAVTLVPPGGDPIAARADPDLTQAFQDVCDAQTAQLFQLTCGVELCAVGMYSTGADVTQALRDHREGGGTLNGEWAVRDVSISGGHSDAPDALLIAAGPSLPLGDGGLPENREQIVELGRLVDLAPSLLALRGLPYGLNMTGRPMPALLSASFAEKFPLTSRRRWTSDDWRPSWTTPFAEERLQDDDSEQRLEQLRSLGYIK